MSKVVQTKTVQFWYHELHQTPADLADPKMKEGDQVMAINEAYCDGKKHQKVCLDSINLLIN